MPEPIVVESPIVGPAAVAAANAATIATLESQGAEKVGGATAQEIAHSGDALDALARAVTEEKEEPAPEPGVAQNGEVVPVVPDPEAAKLEAERAEFKRRSDEFFKDSPALPPNASPKSSEAFNAIKVKAAQEIAARDAKLEEATRKLAEYEAQLSAAPDPALQTELEDHRQWRAKLDVDADPKFKEFDKTVSSSQEFIYAQLRKSPAITPEVIEQIKKLGGPENVNMDKIFAGIKDPTLQRIVESKVADIEMAKFNKEQAIESTKKNIAQYQEERQKHMEANVGSHNKVTEQLFAQHSSKLGWFAEKPLDAKADEPTRKGVEAHNKFVTDTKAQLAEALKDDSANMRAVMLTGMAQLLYLQSLRAGEKAQLEAANKSLAEANAKLEKLTKASEGRLRQTGAAPSGSGPAKSKDLNFDMRPGDALDEIAKQITAERARAANA